MFENFEIIDFRRRKLEEKCKEIEKLLSGEKNYYISPTSYKSGKLIFNEHPYGKNNHFVEGVLEWVEKYIQYKLYKYGLDGGYYEELEEFPFEPGPHEVGHVIKEPLCQWEKDYYEAFIFITLGLALDNEVSKTWCADAGRWESVVERIKAPFKHYDSSKLYRAIIANDFSNRWPVGYESTLYGIFPDLANVYQIVTGKKLSSLLSDEELELAKKTMSDEQQALLNEVQFDADASVSEKYKYSNLFVQYFSDVEYFKKCCRILLSNSVEMFKNRDVSAELENGILMYLEKIKLASWRKDEKFFDSFIYLDKAYELIDDMITWSPENYEDK